jgi:hypothetical protein
MTKDLVTIVAAAPGQYAYLIDASPAKSNSKAYINVHKVQVVAWRIQSLLSNKSNAASFGDPILAKTRVGFADQNDLIVTVPELDGVFYCDVPSLTDCRFENIPELFYKFSRKNSDRKEFWATGFNHVEMAKMVSEMEEMLK